MKAWTSSLTHAFQSIDDFDRRVERQNCVDLKRDHPKDRFALPTLEKEQKVAQHSR